MRKFDRSEDPQCYISDISSDVGLGLHQFTTNFKSEPYFICVLNTRALSIYAENEAHATRVQSLSQKLTIAVDAD